jgi:DNA-binding NarL/FixJ family response regulator
MKKPRVLLADDHSILLEGLKKLLEAEVDLVGTATDGRALIDVARRLKPDVILLDISMPLLNGVEAARRLRKDVPGAKLIFVTMHADPTYVAEALRVGASGYVLKRSAVSELVQAIHQVFGGRSYITPLVRLSSDFLGSRQPAVDLTARQREVVQLLAEGRSPKEIGSLLRISVKTVEFHKYAAMQKLGLHTIAELTKFAVRNRLTEG